MRPSGSPEELERRRFRALSLLKEGCGPSEVARMVGVERRSVRRWKAKVRAKGSSALKAQKASGRPSRLSEEQRQQLEQVLVAGSRAAGFESDLWTCPRVAEVLRKQFSIRYHPDHVCRVLHSLGWTPQRPERRAIERDEAAIQRWVKQEWPRIKKKPRS